MIVCFFFFFSSCSPAESGSGERSQAQHPGGRSRRCEYISLFLFNLNLKVGGLVTNYDTSRQPSPDGPKVCGRHQPRALIYCYRSISEVQHWCSGDEAWMGLRSELCAGQTSSVTPSWGNQFFIFLALVTLSCWDMWKGQRHYRLKCPCMLYNPDSKSLDTEQQTKIWKRTAITTTVLQNVPDFPHVSSSL